MSQPSMATLYHRCTVGDNIYDDNINDSNTHILRVIIIDNIMHYAIINNLYNTCACINSIVIQIYMQVHVHILLINIHCVIILHAQSNNNSYTTDEMH